MEIYINRDQLTKEIEYPQRYQTENLIKTAAVIFIIILAFLLLFKPFGVYAPEEKINYFLICCLHAISPAIILYTYFTTFNYLRTKHTKLKRWSLLLEYGQIACILFIMGVVSFLVRDLIYQNANNWSWHYFVEEIKNCFAAGILFYLFLKLAAFYFQSKQETSFALKIIPFTCEPTKAVTNAQVFIKTQVKQDDFNICLDDLLYAKAEGNYIELTTRRSNEVKTELKRISLTQFQLQISEHPNFFRCHRAYLVNILHVVKASGNSQGYLLSIDKGAAKVPVSRSQLDAFNILFKQFQKVYSA